MATSKLWLNKRIIAIVMPKGTKGYGVWSSTPSDNQLQTPSSKYKTCTALSPERSRLSGLKEMHGLNNFVMADQDYGSVLQGTVC